MRILIQRVSESSVTINGTIHNQIKTGLLILLGIEHEDNESDADWLIQKISSLRIFNDEEGKMNLSVKDIMDEILVISQFTLHASIKKGNRPSFIKAARPEKAIPLYNYFTSNLEQVSELKVVTGEFGADMKVQLTNDGPVTIWLDSKNRE